jgi:hypothetical protein
MNPLLEKLQSSFGQLTKDESRLAEIDRLIRLNDQKRWSWKSNEERLAKRNLHAMERERRDLIVKMTGDSRHQLRTCVKEALAELDKEDSGR